MKAQDLTPRDLATILAALRCWQQDLVEYGDPPTCAHFDAKLTPLTIEEIDQLCERINCS